MTEAQIEPSPIERAWWAVHGRNFALAAGATTTAIVLVGWFTGIREVMYGVLLAFATVALLPLVIIGLGLLLIVAAIFVAAIVAAFGEGADPDGLVEGGGEIAGAGGRIAPGYYRFLSRRRHPAFWGVGAGMLLGGLVLWGLFAILVLPGEARSTDAMLHARAALDAHYANHGEFPRPVGDHLVIDGTTFEDGYGHPLEYGLGGHPISSKLGAKLASKIATWSLRSVGHDGDRGTADDLCATGETPTVQRLREAAKVLQVVKATRGLGEQLESIGAMRCDRL